MMISHIVAIGKNHEIGLGNKMLWHIPADFKNFKKITSGHHILMGRKTFESIGKLLPNRISIIISRDKELCIEGAHVFDTIENGIEFAKRAGERELFICGGAEIYKQTLEISKKIYLSRVDGEFKADTFYPKLDSHWEMCSSLAYPKQKKTYAWDFEILEHIPHSLA